MRSTFVRDWEAVKPFVEYMRRPESADLASVSHSKTIFENFEALAVKWGASAQLSLPLDTTQNKKQNSN